MSCCVNTAVVCKSITSANETKLNLFIHAKRGWSTKFSLSICLSEPDLYIQVSFMLVTLQLGETRVCVTKVSCKKHCMCENLSAPKTTDIKED